MTVRGVDISQYDAPVDFVKLKAAGIEFAIARCVREASLGIDATFAGHVAGARAAGVLPGAYDFLSHGYGAAHAAAFISAVRAAGGPVGMLLALDIEAVLLVAADVDAWMRPVRAAFPGHPIFQYGSQYNVLGTSSNASNGPLWLANYGINPAGSWDKAYTDRGGDGSLIWGRAFNGWTGPAIWQFGSNGAVPGLARSVADLDAFRGTLEQLRAFAGLATPVAGGLTDMSYAFRVREFAAPRTFTPTPGKQLLFYDPDRPGKPVFKATLPGGWTGTATGSASVNWRNLGPNPRPVPDSGGAFGFLEVGDVTPYPAGGVSIDTYRGLLVVASDVTLEVAP